MHECTNKSTHTEGIKSFLSKTELKKIYQIKQDPQLYCVHTKIFSLHLHTSTAQGLQIITMGPFWLKSRMSQSTTSLDPLKVITTSGKEHLSR